MTTSTTPAEDRVRELIDQMNVPWERREGAASRKINALLSEQKQAIAALQALTLERDAMREGLKWVRRLKTAFEQTGSRNQADAYYSFVKGKDAAWAEVDRLIAALPHSSTGEG